MEQIELLEKHVNEQVGNIRHDVNSMRQEMHNLTILLNEREKENDTLKDNVRRLVSLLEGDPMDRDRGLIPRLKTIEDFVSKMKDTRAYLAGNIAAAVFLISAIGGLLAILYKIYLFFSANR